MAAMSVRAARRHADPDHFTKKRQGEGKPMKYLQPDWPAPDHIKAYTTLRQAASTPEQIAASLPLPETPIWIKQVHGATVVDAEQTNAPQEADAIFTSQPNRVCAILT